MKHLFPALLRLGLCLAALGCNPSDHRAAVGAYRLAHAPALPANVEPAPAPELETAVTASESELEAFEERLRQSCHAASEPITTLEMIAYSSRLEECAERRVRALLQRVPSQRRVTLLGATEPPSFIAAPGGWYPAWASFRTAACSLQDAQEFAGSSRTAGTIRGVSRAACRSFSTQRALFWLESLVAGNVNAFARYVRARAELGRRTEANQLVLGRQLQALATSSPETPLEDDHCVICRLGDADFRKLLRAQDAVQATAGALAEATCGSWPELEAELGGKDACRSQARSSWLSEAGNAEGSFDEARWALPQPTDDAQFPPNKDCDYGSFVGPLHATCETTSATPEPEARAACLKRAARAALPALAEPRRSALARIDASWQRFARELCRADADAVSSSSVALAGYGHAECLLLQAARGEYLLSAWARGDVNQLHRHIVARRAWATRSNAAVGKPGSHQGLLRSRRDFAQALCVAWPGLDDTTETCVELIELHLLSYSQYLGALSSGPAAPAAAP